MANENVSPELVDEFERQLILHGISSSIFTETDGMRFALGYLISMLRNGSFNEKEIQYRLGIFKEAADKCPK